MSTTASRGFSPPKLAPTAREFSPSALDINNGVLDATFITHMIPDISPHSGIIGLCAVPHERAGMDDMGWHIADFLAFKALLLGETHRRAQTWLAQCDIPSIVKANPHQYVHGRDRRVVAEAAEASTTTDRAGNIQLRLDQIHIEPSAENLMTDFIAAVNEKCKTIREKGYPLVIIICGPTSIEQDIFFGKADAKYRLTSPQVRNLIGNDVDTIVITPSLFSAGWQVNPSLCRSPVSPVNVDRTTFLAKQFGGIFAKDLVESFLSWKCPLLNVDLVEHEEVQERFPGPAKPSIQQKESIEALQVYIHSALAARLSLGHGDHSFWFDTKRDDWERLVGPRRYRALEHYRQKWENLRMSNAVPPSKERLEFLGTAFGGAKISQINHIKHLIKESFEAWSGYWMLPLGRIAKAKFEGFLRDQSPEVRDCHETFNIMEYRATAAVMADIVTRYLGLPKPYNERCKDWDESRWRADSSDAEQLAVIRPFGDISKGIPSVNVPPAVNPNHLSVIQRRLEVPATYLSVSLYIHYLASTQGIKATVERIQGFFQDIKHCQIRLLLEDPELVQKCTTWLEAIHMPIRSPDDAFATARVTRLPLSAQSIWPRLQNVQDVQDGVRTQTATTRKDQDLNVAPEMPVRASPTLATQTVTKRSIYAELQEVRKEKERLIRTLASASPQAFMEIQKELLEVQERLVGLEREAAEEAQKTGETSKLNASALQFSPSPKNDNIPAQSITATQWPTLQSPSIVVTEDVPSIPRRQHADQLAKENKPLIERPQMSPSPIAQHTNGKMESPNTWMPPHLRKDLSDVVKKAEEKVEVNPLANDSLPPHLRGQLSLDVHFDNSNSDGIQRFRLAITTMVDLEEFAS
ncbi:hypothetical protein F5B20DRAFT_589618 [Whalleya microplaca]|nr:hypothetical protein F5B20DRAFT_589618 [Whalleya microplaca]